ncbi:hypothetical protein HK105_203410 [Polyrhizophydium stewartii]|uniref:TNase-like domain-containing protein n=1 Tax=Polyrhizophydium stewartii TaxID=2732419 RepID=A0ABR4NBR3_9FUNG
MIPDIDADPVAALIVVLVLLVLRLALHSDAFCTLRSNSDVPGDWISKHRVIMGIVLRATDGDGFRMMHIPPLDHWWPQGGVCDPRAALTIRLAGVDAPEALRARAPAWISDPLDQSACFGHGAQPMAAESKAFLHQTLQGRIVRVQLLRRDQYGRLVSDNHAACKRVFWRNVPLEMLRRGLAMVYRAGGAEYGGRLQAFEQAEQQAR